MREQITNKEKYARNLILIVSGILTWWAIIELVKFVLGLI
jgi:hypothetical protein